MGHIRSAELVVSALRASDEGVRDADNTAAHGVAVKTIRRWRRLYQRRGQPRGQAHTQATCPRRDGSALDRSAYAELFGWYLGDGWIEEHRRGVQALHIYNDALYPVLNRRLQDLMRAVKPSCRPHTRLKPGCVVTTVSWTHWTCLFPQHGPGRKHERVLTWSPGRRSWLRLTRRTSSGGSSTPTAAGWTTGRPVRSVGRPSATSTPAGSS